MICLCDWCLVLPKQFLLQTCENQSETLLFCVFKLLHSLKRSDSRSFHDVSSATLTSNSIKGRVSIDFSICVDNLSDNMALNAKRRQDAAAHDSSTASFSTDISEDSGKALEVIRLCSSMLFNHLMNYVGHFPFAKVGPSRISCLVNEFDDNPKLLRTIDTNELNPDLFLAPNVLVMVVNGKSIVSFVDLGAECSDSVSQKDDPVDYLHRLGQVRIIVRDQIGKFAWNFTNLHSTFVESVDDGKQRPNITLPTASAYAEDDDFIYENTRPTDPLDNLMRHLNQFSPECIRRNSSFGPNSIDRSLDPAEENMIALLLNQHFQEMNYADKLSEMDQSGATEIDRISTDYHMKATKYRQNERHSQAPIDFMNSRKLIDQFGFLFWEKRRKLELLAKNDRVLRELRNLDKQKCRETHKIAVIYVKEGQEDKCSILSNQSASKEFEQFVSALGWEIDLARHDGFRGGLEENLSTGKTAPYFANAFYEIIFHVSTRMPNKPDPNTRLKGSNDSDLNRSLDVDAAEQGNEFINRKLRHLGNDEVHIVWSEHFRNYRRGIIPTEFCDVLIVIYPVQSLPGKLRLLSNRCSHFAQSNELNSILTIFFCYIFRLLSSHHIS